MGLTLSILEPKDIGNCSGGGISAHAKSVNAVNVGGCALRSDALPGARLPAVSIIIHPAGRRYGLIAVPEAQPIGMVGPMAGGCYVTSSDGRFREFCEELLGSPFSGAVPLHDRFETQADYDANFD